MIVVAVLVTGLMAGSLQIEGALIFRIVGALGVVYGSFQIWNVWWSIPIALFMVTVYWVTASFLRGVFHGIGGFASPDTACEVLEKPQEAAIVSVERNSGALAPVASIAEEHLQGIEKIYLAPNIPDRKLKGARRKLLSQADPQDELVGLVDITVFGGGADGIAIFEGYIIYADFTDDACRYVYTELKNPPPERKGGRVKAGNKTLKLYDGDQAKAFALFLSSVCEHVGRAP